MKLITSSQNSLIKHLIRLQKESSYRKECKVIFLEGKKLVLEALKEGKAKTIYLEEGLELEADSTFLSRALVEKISTLKNSEGYFAEVQRPENHSLEGFEKVLVFDRIQNPENLGALIRSAVALGYQGAFILEGSCDPYSPRVLRSSMGACLNFPIFQGSQEELQALIQAQSFHLYVADGSGTEVNKVPIKKPFMLVLGNESIGSELKSHPNATMIAIPIQQVDSLNVSIAGSLLMYEMGRSS